MTVRGIEVVTANLKHYSDEVKQAIVNANNATAQAVRTTAIRSVQRSPGSGKTYEKYNPRRTHRASSPGNAPRTDTGRLVGAIRAELARKSSPVAKVGVTTAVEYGFWLEFGTMNIAPRPFMIPALEENMDNYERTLRAMIADALK